MPSKNNLSALKQDRKPKPILPSADQVERGPTTSENLSAEPTKKKTIGRPRKDPKDKRDYKITLSLTKSEGMTINEKAGLAGEATYLYDLLKKAGAFD
jgi:hypothetical protein|tara:strand:- start:1489 stop:1782 length:294 start_codon:yes stop_codon:yes gene_type:complete